MLSGPYSDYWLLLLGKGSKIREHGNVVRLVVGSVATERAPNARGFSYGAWGVVNPESSSHVSALGIGLVGGPILLYFLSLVSVPLIIVPYRLVPRPMFVPKRGNQQGVVDSRVYCSKLRLL